MSLRIWLPLNGDLHNQGCSNVTVTNNGTTVNTSGKIGSCYSFDGSSYLSFNKQIFDTNTFSVSFWIKANNISGNKGIINCRNASNKSFAIYLIDAQIRIDTGSNWSTGYSLTASTWTHITFTTDGVTERLYVNGIQSKNRSYTSVISTITNFCTIGCEHTNGSNLGVYFNGYLNDIRIYNHCLSAAEVREIAQGLIVHYKLNNLSDIKGNSNNNLIYNTALDGSTSLPTKWANWGSPPTREIITINNKKWFHIISNTTAFQGYSQNWTHRQTTAEIIPGTQVTMSAIAYASEASSFRFMGFHWCDSSGAIIGQSWPTYAVTTVPTRFTTTITTPANCVKFNVMIGDGTTTAHEVWISDVKLEMGNTATEWSSAYNDTDTIIPQITDDSGYQHNGLINGALQTQSDSLRYSNSINFSSGAKINSNTGFPTDSNPIFTVSYWVKTNTGSFSQWADIISFYGNATIRQETNNTSGTSLSWWNYPLGTSSGMGGISVTNNVWTHFALSSDGQKFYFYKNGELYGTTNISGTAWTPNGSFSIGDNGMNMNISDLRIYCTVLSADDVLQLYHTSAKIDNKQNLHTFELIENQSKISINKQGQTLCNELTEDTSTKFYKTDQIIETNEIIEL